MTIAIIDQFPVLRMGMALFLVDQFKSFTLIESDSLLSFHDSNPDANPDVIVLALSQESGLANLQLIYMANRWYDLKKVIFYDEATDYQMMPSYYKLGAYNYLSKQSNLRELKACIDQILKNRGPLGVSFSNKWGKRLIQGLWGESSLLTKREYQIALYLSEGKNPAWIAEKLQVKRPTISVTKRRVFKKLNIDNVIKLKELIRCF
jgi:DNA-binding NarL/FixJ family response regulator